MIPRGAAPSFRDPFDLCGCQVKATDLRVELEKHCSGLLVIVLDVGTRGIVLFWFLRGVHRRHHYHQQSLYESPFDGAKSNVLDS